MSATTITSIAEPNAESKMLVMAVGIIFERVMRLDPQDRQDLFELTDALRTATTNEEWLAAQKAVLEILDQPEMTSRPIPLEPTPKRSGLQKWVDFVSNRIRQLRKERDWTQEQLAEKAGLPQSHISRIENGQHSPSHVTLEKIARAFDVQVSVFDPSV